MGIGRSLGRAVAPRVHRLAPDLTTAFVHEALDRAVHGAGPLPGAARAAEKALADAGGDDAAAVRALIESHVRYAGGQGFATNVGGLLAAAVTIPANIAGLALLQCRMVAAIAHLRGYDLEDGRVRNAVLACLLGPDKVEDLVRRRKLPAPPMALATAPVRDPDLDRVMAAEVTSELLTKIAGKQVVSGVGRRVPVVGGLVGAGADGYATWRIGRYADTELRRRGR